MQLMEPTEKHYLLHWRDAKFKDENWCFTCLMIEQHDQKPCEVSRFTSWLWSPCLQVHGASENHKAFHVLKISFRKSSLWNALHLFNENNRPQNRSYSMSRKTNARKWLFYRITLEKNARKWSFPRITWGSFSEMIKNQKYQNHRKWFSWTISKTWWLWNIMKQKYHLGHIFSGNDVWNWWLH